MPDLIWNQTAIFVYSVPVACVSVFLGRTQLGLGVLAHHLVLPVTETGSPQI